MPFPGYAGSVLYVDLTRGTARTEALPQRLVELFLGGYGINNRLAYDLIPPDRDPLVPENCIILGAGPFSGTLVPGSAKVLVTTKFPLNNAFATAVGGGGFALRLKSAGYDHVVISGKAPQPVFLKIAEDSVELKNARHLWGKDNFETTDELRSHFEPCSIIPIGQAGENLVKLSLSLMDKASTLGRGGLPAIMGAKNLKAIVVVQGNHPVRVADPAKFMKLINELHERVMRWQGRQPLLEAGLAFTTDCSLHQPSPQIMEIHKALRKVLACPSCPVGEKSKVRLTQGEYAGLTAYMTHLWMEELGREKPAEAYAQAIKLNDTLDRYGLCNMTFTHLFFLFCRLYQEEIITREDTGGLELKPDLDTALTLARMTAYREGLGDTLAEGPLGAIQRIGRGAEKYLEHIKGQSIVLDPRLTTLGTMEFDQIVNPRGAHVASGGSPSYDPGRPPGDFARHAERMGASPEAIKRAVSPAAVNIGRYTKFGEDWNALFNSLGMCGRAFVNRFYHIDTITQLYSALTGREVSPPYLMKAAERAWNLGKLLNVRAGFTRQDDQPPSTWTQPLERGGRKHRIQDYFQGTPLTWEDLQKLIDDYYAERGYDVRSGVPLSEVLADLGLG